MNISLLLGLVTACLFVSQGPSGPPGDKGPQVQYDLNKGLGFDGINSFLIKAVLN